MADSQNALFSGLGNTTVICATRSLKHDAHNYSVFQLLDITGGVISSRHFNYDNYYPCHELVPLVIVTFNILISVSKEN